MQFLLLNSVNAHPKKRKILQMNPQKNSNLHTSIKHHNCTDSTTKRRRRVGLERCERALERSSIRRYLNAHKTSMPELGLGFEQLRA
jgi:hypothetical protein